MGRYLAIWFGSSIAVIALVALANWQLDAYGYWGNAKAVYYSTERQFKASRIHHYPHDSLLLGTSRFAFIDPERLICGSYFNAAFSGATLAELVEFVERFVDHPRLVIVGLDFQMFDNSVEPNEQGGFGRTPKDFAKHLLSLNMLYRGIVTKRLNLAGVQPKILGNGQRNAARLNREDAGLSGTSYDKKSLADVRNSFKNFRVITNAELLLTRLKSTLLRRASRTIVVFNPVNTVLRDDFGYMDVALGDIKEVLKRIFPDYHDLSQSRYAAPEFHYKHDFAHFTTDTGVTFVNNILRKTVARCR